ncbi:helix-turn-helix domain-containing protein [Marivirga arenosa]|uniref:Helix-turn-helix transcriptional regulator n=1 Tax=Marivirga arenosa TaxID=3059076 RepID=A0AA49JCM9_9BACT|nr:helix-turn-helix transcriptional regulator [Marivirga sp. BKB1-2]WKK79937.2 helix-turn-helix transcriptional regulator [Marivirga sp. BKB1-2]
MKLLIAAVIGVLVFVIFQMLRKDVANKRSQNFSILLQTLWLIRFFLIYIKLDLNETPAASYIIYDQTLLLLDGPLFWLYTRSLIDSKRLSIKDFIHFIPFILLFILSTFQLIADPATIVNQYQQAVNNMLNGSSMADLDASIFILFAMGLSLIYIVRAVKIARIYNRGLLDRFSTIDSLKANWIISFQRWWIGLFFLPLLIYFILYVFPFISAMYVAGTVLISISAFSIFFSSHLLNQNYAPPKLVKNKKAAVSTSTVNNRDHLFEQLSELKEKLEKEKYYLDEELSLNKLSDYIGIKPTHLTELIKLSEFENFYDFINSYRIEEIKEKLIETDEQIIVIAYQNGFKSKSTFNKIFKEKTGYTPKQYRLSKK